MVLAQPHKLSNLCNRAWALPRANMVHHRLRSNLRSRVRALHRTHMVRRRKRSNQPQMPQTKAIVFAE